MNVEVLSPHGLCAGVNAAIARALKLKDVYCLHGLVHNELVIDELKALGYRFVEDVDEIPEGETVVFSAHGVSPAIRARAKARRLRIVDTTCPFVERVHRAVRAFADRGLPVLVLGDNGHAEVRGVVGEAEGRVPVTVARPDAAESVRVAGAASGDRIGVVAQTTLNAADVEEALRRLKARYAVETAAAVCQATRERQDAVRRFCAAGGDRALLVLGSAQSANSRRLAEVAEEAGVRAFLASDMDAVSALRGELERHETVGVTSGASTPERIFDEVVAVLRHIPRHLAIIMDGNGRWATRRGKRRGEGHIAGAKTLTNVLRWCGDRGIRYLTVYAFSTENWNRPREEVEGLMKLFARLLRTKESDFIENRVRFRMIGRRGDLSPSLRRTVERLEEKTAAFERQFLVAISYGGRAEIVDAANAAIARGEPVTEETFRNGLYAPDVPDPDLVIRTSGECRTSNFLLWETAYSEYHFTETLWPDFSEADLDRALADYAGRNRRRGGV